MRIIEYRGKWCAASVVDGKRRRLSLGNLAATEENRPAAERAAVDLERALAEPIGDIVGDVVEAYLDDTKAITKDYMKIMWRILKPYCAALRVDQIDRAWCRDYVAARGKAPATVRKEISMLSAAFRWAGKTGFVIELPSAPPPRDRWLTRVQFSMLLDAAAGQPHLVVFLHLAIATGGRKEALLALTWPQVDFDRRTIWLGRKEGGKGRAIVPINQTLYPVLRAAKAQAQSDHVVEYDGQPVKNVKKSFAAACRRAGLSDFTPHDLRHTAAVWMAEAGTPMSEIAQYLGHSDSRITERVYARYSPDYLRKAASALDL
ncbi:tyrosine-type recombinase/integrase [Phaeospirillum tilakii]|uniref:Tyrosine-type recombinase/integrase n=1 Tax=Phaeospirillum tilakii TaxID=741673 RepID=A0ABW5C7G7_9PROT